MPIDTVETTPVPSTSDKFLAALSTLYRRYSVQLDLAASAFMTWLLMLPATCVQGAADCTSRTDFMAHFGIPVWVLPPLFFILRAVTTAVPQPAMRADTDAKASALSLEK